MPIAMTISDATNEIGALCDSTGWPALSATQLSVCVTLSKRRDDAGYAPTDASYTPTFDTKYGAAMGFLLRAGNVASRYDVDASKSQKFARSQAAKGLREQAKALFMVSEPVVERFYTYEDLNVNKGDGYALSYDLNSIRWY
jgi:hypothetical protein